MTISEIETFLTIVRYGSISKAAKVLYTSQPTLSAKISSLEDELGCKLLHRGKGQRGIELTEEGSQFLQYARSTSELWAKMIDVKNGPHKQRLRISALNSISVSLLSPVIHHFMLLHPDILVETMDHSSYSSYDAIEQELVDLAFIVDQRYSDIAVTTPVLSEQMHIVHHPDMNIKEYNNEQLQKYPQIVCPWNQTYEQWIRSHPFSSHLQVQIIAHLQYFLTNTVSWALVPKSVADFLTSTTNIQVIPTPIDKLTRTIYTLTPQRKNDLVDEFMSIFYKMYNPTITTHIH